MAEKRYTEYLNGPDGFRAYDLVRVWNTSRKPYHSPQRYDFQRWKVTSYVLNSDSGTAFYPHPYDCFLEPWFPSDLQNKVYGKLVDATGSPAQWANNMIEAEKSVSGIVSRAAQLGRAAVALRKGNFGGALSALGHPDNKPIRRKLDRAKSFGNQWLELHFGWVPLIDDISNSLKTLSKTDFGTRKIAVSAGGTRHYHERLESSPNFRVNDWTLVNRQKAGMRVRIDNPNAYLANQFGVANPLSVAWEAVPYSFVVDWFSNVGQCLSAMTDFMGLTIEDPYHTESIDATYSYVVVFGHASASVAATTHGFYVARRPEMLGPTLALKPFKGFSPIRGATAISLLLQKL